MKMVNGSFVKERESLSCCDWFSMKLHEMMFRIKTSFDSDNNFHYSPLSHGGHIGYDVCILGIKSRRCVFNFSGLQLIMLNKIIVVCSCAQITDQKVN